jgi:CBS domain-containing protein
MAGLISVKDIMTRNVVTTRVNASAREAVKTMESQNIGSIVVMEHDRPVGIITERDIVVRIASPSMDPRNMKVQDIMSSPLVTIKGDASVEEAVALMDKRNIKKIVVMEDGKLAGMLTYTDIARSAPHIMKLYDELQKNRK